MQVIELLACCLDWAEARVARGRVVEDCMNGPFFRGSRLTVSKQKQPAEWHCEVVEGGGGLHWCAATVGRLACAGELLILVLRVWCTLQTHRQNTEGQSDESCPRPGRQRN